mmetsp:Transcript_54008/g.94825  ORF Transcript_54008/g.94825 Transcript_54008/m.94825 type:complete len:491 (+) Transcript_54008:88-1560(+)
MTATMDPELVEMVKCITKNEVQLQLRALLREMIMEICRDEVQLELRSLRADINKMQRDLGQVQFNDFHRKGSSRGSPRQCSVPWECLDGRGKETVRDRSVFHRPPEFTYNFLPLVQDQENEDSSPRSLDDFEQYNLKVEVTNPHVDVAAASAEYQEILRNAGNSTRDDEFNHNVWSATAFVVVKDFADVAMGKCRLEICFRMGMVLFCYGLNIFLQFMLVFWISTLVILPNVSGIQETYKEFHSVAFNHSGVFDIQGFHSLGEHRKKLCQMAITKRGFLSVCIFLWISTCVRELKDDFRRWQLFKLLPKLPAGVAPTHMVYQLSMHKMWIVCLSDATRTWLCVLVFIPRFMVAVCLLVIGAVFLSASQSFTDLILNSLAMEFIFNADDIIFEVFLPSKLRTNLDQTTVRPPDAQDILNLTDNERVDANIKRDYSSHILLLICVIIFLVAWHSFQPIIPDYEYDVGSNCIAYLNAVSNISCKMWDHDCFPK